MSGSASQGRWLERDHPFYLVLALCLSILVQPMLEHLPLAALIISVFSSLIILSSLLSVLGHREVLFFLVILAVPALALEWVGHAVSGSTTIESATAALWTVAWLYIAKAQLLQIMKTPVVTDATIWRAISAYLLIGIAWAMLYRLVVTFDAAAFNGLTADGPRQQFVYFSFTVLTTLGFGDIAPVASYARSLVILEAVVGPLYLAVLIARLVGVYAREASESRGSESEGGN